MEEAGIDVNLMNITMFIPDTVPGIEYYKLLKNGDVTRVRRYDRYSMKLLKEVNGKAIIIDVSILYNIHKTYELKWSVINNLRNRHPSEYKALKDRYRGREERRINDLSISLLNGY